jgi:hypothetical protein
VVAVNPSYPYDPARHHRDTVAAAGRCSQHGKEVCDEPPVISFEDRNGRWQSGCDRALAELVLRREIVPPAEYAYSGAGIDWSETDWPG